MGNLLLGRKLTGLVVGRRSGEEDYFASQAAAANAAAEVSDEDFVSQGADDVDVDGIDDDEDESAGGDDGSEDDEQGEDESEEQDEEEDLDVE